jgi:peptidoglycan/LPS O-acetylase OafA/YrhL
MNSIPRKGESATVVYLRGLASFGVVMYHVREDLWVGWNSLHYSKSATLFDKSVALLSIPAPFLGTGVILFFLLSGFCISLPYVGINSRKLELKEYSIRRFFRIYPPYLCAIILTFVIELVLSQIHKWHITSFTTYLANLLMVQNYTTGVLQIDGALWTLPIEMELYIAFPIVLFLLLRWGPKVLISFTGIVSLTILIIFLNGVHWLESNFAMYWLVWSAGAVLAKYYAAGTLKMPSKWIIISGIISLIIAVVAQSRGIPSTNLDLLYGYFYLTLLWYGLVTEHIWAAHVPELIVKVLTILGTCSYSLYLIHKPIFRLFGVIWSGYFGSKPVNFLIPTAFALLVVCIAWGFYNLIEAPSHKLAKKIANRIKKPAYQTEKIVKV